MNRHAVALLCALAVGSSSPNLLSGQASTAVRACSLLSKEEVKRHVPWHAMFDSWELEDDGGSGFAGPTLLVAGRQDSTVGYAATVDLADSYPGSTLAVVDGAGHALPHERPHLLGALVRDWLARVAATTVPTSRG